MTSSIKFGFFGSYKCDLILYLARICLVAGKKVAIIDATKEHIWDYQVPKISDDSVVTHRGLDIFLNCDTQESLYAVSAEAYDILFTDHGFNKGTVGFFGESDVHCIVTDLNKSSIIRLSSFCQAYQNWNRQGEAEEKTEFIRIYRDIVDSKINIQYINKILDMDDSVNIVLDYALYLDDMDYRCRLEAQYNDTVKFTKLSKASKSMLREIVESTVQVEKKQLNKALRKAERGR